MSWHKTHGGHAHTRQSWFLSNKLETVLSRSCLRLGSCVSGAAVTVEGRWVFCACIHFFSRNILSAYADISGVLGFELEQFVWIGIEYPIWRSAFVPKSINPFFFCCSNDLRLPDFYFTSCNRGSERRRNMCQVTQLVRDRPRIQTQTGPLCHVCGDMEEVSGLNLDLI